MYYPIKQLPMQARLLVLIEVNNELCEWKMWRNRSWRLKLLSHRFSGERDENHEYCFNDAGSGVTAQVFKLLEQEVSFRKPFSVTASSVFNVKYCVLASIPGWRKSYPLLPSSWNTLFVYNFQSSNRTQWMCYESKFQRKCLEVVKWVGS